MKFSRPKEILAGFWVDAFDTHLPELRSFGEHWTPDGWTVHLHRHPYWELYYQASGSSRWLPPGRGEPVAEWAGVFSHPWHRSPLSSFF